MRLSDLLVVVPPVVRVVKEFLDSFLLKLSLKTCLSLDDFLSEELLSGERRTDVNVHRQHAKTPLMRQTYGKHFRINLDLVTVESWAPVDVLGAEDDGFLVDPMLEDGHMNRLVQLQKHRWVELDLLVVADKLKHEGFIEDGVARRRHYLSAVPVLQETHCDGDLLVGADVDEVDEGVSADD